jgi:hypothetical protein
MMDCPPPSVVLVGDPRLKKVSEEISIGLLFNEASSPEQQLVKDGLQREFSSLQAALEHFRKANGFGRYVSTIENIVHEVLLNAKQIAKTVML